MALVKLSVTRGEATSIKADVVVVAVPAEEVDKGKLKGPTVKALDKALGGVLAQVVGDAGWEGGSSSEIGVHTHGRLGARQLVLLGLGRKPQIDRNVARQAGGRAARAVEKACGAKAALVFPFGDDPALLEAAAEGAELGAYRFDKYLSEKKPRRLKELAFVLDRAPKAADRTALQTGSSLGESVNLARDLVNEPACEINPTNLAKVAQSVAKEGGLKIEVLDRRAIERLKMNMFLGVTQGSEAPPKLIHMWWEPAGGKKAPPVAIVGKAITFDSGGLSLKPPQGMETMKTDMAGSAAVIGAMKMIARIKPKFPVHAFIGACENMPSGTAQRPGDVVRARNGKTVEVLNTDAEGRLVLGDVLSWAVDFKPAAIVDLATLTGACIIALGPYTAGLFSSDDQLASDLLGSAAASGEDVWRLPLTESLKELIKSPIADLKNTGGRSGGAITAALFLREFVNGIPWAHIDIAGPSSLDKEKGLEPRGGTGMGVRTLVEWIRRRSAA